MLLVVSRGGEIRSLYDEAVDLTQLGPAIIRRGSFVEPDSTGQWRADMSLLHGPVLGPFAKRSQALAAETTWLVANWLVPAAHETHGS